MLLAQHFTVKSEAGFSAGKRDGLQSVPKDHSIITGFIQSSLPFPETKLWKNTERVEVNKGLSVSGLGLQFVQGVLRQENTFLFSTR